MFRRGGLLLASHIPRSVWDPAHHNENWTDSYGTDIAARRQWPSKKWSVGLEPRTPSDWLKFSKRNLAYSYNGAMRACSTFPEMLDLYREMKQREVQVDVDTMTILLTRGARFEGLQVDDLFLLFDELVSLGARPDITAVETLHTVLDHSAGMPVQWREVRRRQLVEWYNRLAVEMLERFRPRHDHHQMQQPVDALMSKEMKRLRDNLRQLHASLSPHVYRQYFHALESSSTLLLEVHHFMWEFVQPDHPASEIPSLGIRVPYLGSVMKRPALPDGTTAAVQSNAMSFTAFPAAYPRHGAEQLRVTDFEDSDVCSVVLAAVERVVEADFHLDPPQVTQRRLFLSLLSILAATGVLYTADLMAQLMDIVKYSGEEAVRDGYAQRVLRYALRGSSASRDEAYRRLWLSLQPVVDGRVLGRYLASRHPWTLYAIHYDQQLQFRTPYVSAPAPSDEPSAVESAAAASKNDPAESEVTQEEVDRHGSEGEAGRTASTTSPAPVATASSSLAPHLEHHRTAAGLASRWADVQAIIRATKVLQPPPHFPHGDAVQAKWREATMEVFTGQMVLLRTAATDHRYESLEEALATQAQGDELQRQEVSHPTQLAARPSSAALVATLPLSVWQLLLQCLKEVHQAMEEFMATYATPSSDGSTPAVEPEFECWEGMLTVLRCVMDYCAATRQKVQAAPGTVEKDIDGGRITLEALEKLFAEASEMRGRLVEESLTRFNGRMRILWLQES